MSSFLENTFHHPLVNPNPNPNWAATFLQDAPKRTVEVEEPEFSSSAKKAPKEQWIDWAKAERVFLSEEDSKSKIIIGKNIMPETIHKIREEDGTKRANLWKKYRCRYDANSMEVYFFKCTSGAHGYLSGRITASLYRQFGFDTFKGRSNGTILLPGSLRISQNPNGSICPTGAPRGVGNVDEKRNNCPTAVWEIGYSEDIKDLHNDIVETLKHSDVQIGIWVCIWNRAAVSDTYKLVIALYDKGVNPEKPYDVVSFGTKPLCKDSQSIIFNLTSTQVTGYLVGERNLGPCHGATGLRTVYVEVEALFRGFPVNRPNGLADYWEIDLVDLSNIVENENF